MDQFASIQLEDSSGVDPVKHSHFAAFSNAFEHIEAELYRLDLLLTRCIYRFRQSLSLTEESVRAAPNFVSHEEVDQLLNEHPLGYNVEAMTDQHIDALNQALEQQQLLIDTAVELSFAQSVHLPLVSLAQSYGLSPLEMDMLLVCWAPEFRRKYDRIYAYLQDDISRKRPSVDLVLQILFDDERSRWQARSYLMSNAPLLTHRFLHVLSQINGLTGSSDLSTFLQLDERILGYILGNNAIDKRLQDLVEILPTGADQPPHLCAQKEARLAENLIESSLTSDTRAAVWIELQGPKNAGKQWLASKFSREYSPSLLVANLRSMIATDADFLTTFSLLCREALLSQTPIYFEDFSALSQVNADADIKALLRIVEDNCWLVFTDGPWSCDDKLEFENMRFLSINMGLGSVFERRDQWLYYLEDMSLVDKSQALTLANQYQLMPKQIALVARTAKNIALANGGEIDMGLLQNICKRESSTNLGKLSSKVKASYSWNDLVMPPSDLATLRSICQQVSNHYKVFDEWGFDNKISYGRGLSVLFSGKPGTGKTMAAQVLANQMALDLYKIDLSGVVSKYIGETEKNLDRIFGDAEFSNVILFFDEADALFGKRSEISDAHDRYANIETSYLLQKIEEYNGIVILATNYRKNMDDAFVRRIRFILEFQFPDESNREEIWRKMLPKQTPLEDDIDYNWLAKNMKISGGSIKNIVLNAAFYAADENRALGMKHLYQGCHDEYKKMGRLWDESVMRYRDMKANAQ